jgi:hypothetical protein
MAPNNHKVDMFLLSGCPAQLYTGRSIDSLQKALELLAQFTGDDEEEQEVHQACLLLLTHALGVPVCMTVLMVQRLGDMLHSRTFAYVLPPFFWFRR